MVTPDVDNPEGSLKMTARTNEILLVETINLPRFGEEAWNRITIHQSFIKKLSQRNANKATANTRDIRSYFRSKQPPAHTVASHDDKPP